MGASDKLQWILTANADGAISAFKKVGDTAEKELTKAQSHSDKLGATMTKVGTGAMAFAGVTGAALFKTATSFENLAIESGKFADATGLTVEQSSRFIEVLGDIGIDSGAAEKSIGFMNKTLGNSPKLFSDLGVEVAKTKDGTTDANATFLAVIDHLNGIQDPAQRAAEGAKLLGRGWASMADVIAGGSASLTASLAAVSDAKVINESELTKAKEMRAALDTAKDSVEDLALSIGAGAAPAISMLAQGIGTAIQAFDNLNSISNGAAGGILAIGTAAIGVAGSITFIAGQAVKLRDTFSSVDAEGARSLNNLGKGLVATTAVIGIAAVAYAAYNEDKKKAQQTTDDFVSALAAEKAGQEGATRALIAKKIVETDALGVSTRLGLSQADIAAAITGKQIPAIDELRSKVKYLVDHNRSWDTTNKELQDSMGLSVGEAQNFLKAIDLLNGSYGDAINYTSELATTEQALKDTEEAATTTVDKATTARRGSSVAIAEHSQALIESKRRTIDAAQANDELETSLTNADTALQMLKGHLSERDAWRNEREAIADLKTMVDSGKASWDDLGAATDEAVSKTADYIATADDIPTEVKTYLYQELDKGNLDYVTKVLADLHNGVTVPLFLQTVGKFDLKGTRAAGGPVSNGTYLVGERGPELLDIGGNGNITPADQTARMLNAGPASGGATVVENHFHMEGAVVASAADFERMVTTSLKRARQRGVQI